MPEIDAAETLLRAGDFDAARRTLTEAQKKNPRLAAAGVIVARWYLANNQIAQARSELEQVVARTPGEPEPYAMLGELGLARSADCGNRAVVPRGAGASRFAQGLCRPQGGSRGPGSRRIGDGGRARSQWSMARDELAAWVMLNEKNPIPHQRLGNALFHLGKAKDAFAEFQTAGKLDPEFTAETALAKSYEESGNRAEAARMMNAAVKRLPGNVAVRLAVANWELEANRIAKAKLQVEAALKADTEFARCQDSGRRHCTLAERQQGGGALS